MTSPRIYADFNNADAQGRVRLNVQGAIDDLRRLGLSPSAGMVVTLYDDELEAAGVVEFNSEEKIWVATIDWNRLVVDDSTKNRNVDDRIALPPLELPTISPRTATK